MKKKETWNVLEIGEREREREPGFVGQTSVLEQREAPEVCLQRCFPSAEDRERVCVVGLRPKAT